MTKSIRLLFPSTVLALLLVNPFQPLSAQNTALQQNPDSLASLFDPCGFDPIRSLHLLQVLGPGWGYNYDSLLVDLGRWQNSPFVQIDSVGASVQNRALWLLTVTDPAPVTEPKLRIWIHARTHPGEVQGWWVTNEIIKILLDDTPVAQLLRARCIFNIMPMYNPDGVELGLPRENAHGIDIESNWNKNPNEPEVIVLRNQFTRFMASESPILIALNMHSAFACQRYFVYHDAAGTSPAYAIDEQNFIGGIRSYWPEGIQPYTYFVSWTLGTPTQYPESWFWLNHGAAVMALTYEDMNCESAGQFDRTADAIISGIVDYLVLDLGTAVTEAPAGGAVPRDFALFPAFPNPVSRSQPGRVQFELAQPMAVELVVYDVLGHSVKTLFRGTQPQGKHTISYDLLTLPSGTYALRLSTPAGSATRLVTVVR